MRGRGIRRSRRQVASRMLPDTQLEMVAFELELTELVLAHHFEDLRDLVEIHQKFCSSRGTEVSTSQPVSVTSTSSSIRTPPKPER